MCECAYDQFGTCSGACAAASAAISALRRASAIALGLTDERRSVCVCVDSLMGFLNILVKNNYSGEKKGKIKNY